VNRRSHCAKLAALAVIAPLAASGCKGTASTADYGPLAQAIVVTVAPEAAVLAPDHNLALEANVTGTADTSVDWSVQEGPPGGVVTGAGLYTAPSSTGIFHVVATSRADPTASGAAVLTVTSGPPPGGSSMTTASRVSGVAPLGVFFDAIDGSATTDVNGKQLLGWAGTSGGGTGVVQPSDPEGALYSWDFGDPASGTFTVSTTGKSRNTATGYTTAHVYETPGTYTVTLTVTQVNGTINTYTQQITVSGFSGTTRYIAAGATGAGDGTSEANAWGASSIATAIAWVNGGANRQLLFKRGDSFALGSRSISGAGPGIVGAYGTGNRPILTGSGASAILDVSGNDWRIVDLDIQHSRRPTSADDGSRAVDVSGDNVTVLRVKGTGAWVVFSNTYGLTRGNIWADCESTTGAYQTYFAGFHEGIIGCNFHDSTVTHVVRFWIAQRVAVQSSRLFNPAATRHALKLHADVSQNYGSAIASISDNIAGGASTWTFSIGPQDELSNEAVTRVVLERNRFYGNSTSAEKNDIEISARVVVIRNNVFDATGASFYEAISVSRRGIEPAPQNYRIFNNTMFRNDSGEMYGLLTDSTATNLQFRNNLIYTASPGTLAVSSGSPGSGSTISNNLATRTPGFTNVGAADVTLAAGSAAANAGVTLGEVRQDYAGTGRPVGSAYDLGARESR
jgi:PKD repeat protein